MSVHGVAIYVEGGGDTASAKADLRWGFDELLRQQKECARERRWAWRLTTCGSRGEAYRAFAHALAVPKSDVIGLLVDAEGPVADVSPEGRVAHLRQRDGWNLTNASAPSVHLMIQCMEAWLVADPAALAAVYGKGFHARSLPPRRNLDDEPKASVLAALQRAAKPTARGSYGKIRDASEIFTRLDPGLVAARCPSFAAFRDWLTSSISGARSRER